MSWARVRPGRTDRKRTISSGPTDITRVRTLFPDLGQHVHGKPLAANSELQVVVGTRSPEKWHAPGTTAVRLDLDRVETLAPALEGVERAFLVTGYTVDMLRQSKDFLNAAKRAGVKEVVHLGACGDDDTRVDHYAWHQFIERYIQWCEFSFTHLRPEVVMQNLLGYGGESFVKDGVIRHFVGNARLSWVDCEDVAAVAAACLLDPAKHAGQTYRLGYEARTFHDVVETFTRVLGQPFRYEARSTSAQADDVPPPVT